MRGRKGTGEFGSRENARNLKSIICRLHINDHTAMKPLFVKDGISFQNFVVCMLEAYLLRDQNVLKVIDDWKKVNLVRWKDESKFDFSPRERRAILDELENTYSDDNEDD